MLLLVLMLIGLFISVGALGMTIWNLSQYPQVSPGVLAPREQPLITICIPARNEQANIEACVQGLLASTHENLEVLVYDDQSTDQTPAIISSLMRKDARVQSVPTVPLPAGWNGKQHACYRCSLAAKGTWLLFTDADVRFEPAALSSALTAATQSDLALVSTFPRQITRSLAEHLAVPMIFFILFSYLPFVRMRTTKDPSTSAGCGQFLFVRSDAYQAAGTHAAFKNSMHDGIKMPRAVRTAGFMTGLFDGTSVVSCRMYFDFASTWRGFAKNAYEGLGSVGLLVFLTIMHMLGHVLPWIVLVYGLQLRMSGVVLSVALPAWLAQLLSQAAELPTLLAAAACCTIHLAQRIMLASRLRTSIIGALLHPFGVLMMTLIQWHSFIITLRGKREWRGRVASATVS